MSITVQKGMVPPGGWHFPAEPGVILRADSYLQLEDALMKHRMRMGQRTDAVKQEIDRYFCARWPSFCVDDRATTSSFEGLDKRVARYASNVAREQPAGGYLLETQTVANTRAEICAKCPENRSWKTGCSGCAASVAQLLVQLRRLRNTPVDGKLKACMHCGGECSTMVHLPVGAGSTGNTEGAPLECWRHKNL